MKHVYLTGSLVAVLFATSATAAVDKFNRATLGSKWVAVSGSQSISNDKFVGDTGSLGYDKRSKADTSVSAIVSLGGTDLEYGAVASGDIAGGNNAFVKIQAQTGDGNFSNAGFYTGNNGSVDFFALSSEIPSPATLSVTFCGTVATMKIKSSAKTQVYNFDYGTSFGTGGGLGTFGSVALDNYRSTAGGCAFQEQGVWIKKGSGKARDLSLSK
ncbi:MAG: hypothetical protein ABI306_07535 [Caulobacteraceae bacterium]